MNLPHSHLFNHTLISGIMVLAADHFTLAKNRFVTPQLLGLETVSECLKTTLRRLKIACPHPPRATPI